MLCDEMTANLAFPVSVGAFCRAAHAAKNGEK
jgi:hypothetical protein